MTSSPTVALANYGARIPLPLPTGTIAISADGLGSSSTLPLGPPGAQISTSGPGAQPEPLHLNVSAVDPLWPPITTRDEFHEFLNSQARIAQRARYAELVLGHRHDPVELAVEGHIFMAYLQHEAELAGQTRMAEIAIWCQQQDYYDEWRGMKSAPRVGGHSLRYFRSVYLQRQAGTLPLGGPASLYLGMPAVPQGAQPREICSIRPGVSSLYMAVPQHYMGSMSSAPVAPYARTAINAPTAPYCPTAPYAPTAAYAPHGPTLTAPLPPPMPRAEPYFGRYEQYVGWFRDDGFVPVAVAYDAYGYAGGRQPDR